MSDTATVLIVDDNDHTLDIFGHYVEHNGMESMIARSVAEALEFIQDRVPDVILLDQKLPLQPGTTLLEYMHGRPAFEDTRVIMISAHEFHLSEEEASRMHKPMLVLRKPIRLKTLSDAIDRALA